VKIYAFHDYKGKNYIGIYVIRANNLEFTLEKLKENDVFGFTFNGGWY